MNTGKLKVTTPSDREIAMTRVFDAPRSLVFDAWTKPELLKRWLGVRAGWSLAVCEVDLKVGGVYREIVRPERIVATEKFDEPWYPGEALDTTVMVEKGGGRTTVTTTVRYDSKETRDAVLETPMAKGIDESYDKLDEVLASAVAKA